MGQLDDRISDRLRDFIAAQHLFFVATAPREGPINLSPKGIDSLRVLGPRNVRWLNLTGSGNETAAHLREDDRITLMFCALEGAPSIVRLYGRARAADPAHRNAAMSLGVLHTRRGRDDLAQRVFMGALERDPANPGAASELAQLHARQGDLPAAFAVLTGTLAHVPEEHVLWEMAGRFHCENGRGREGEQMLARAAEIRPDRPSPHQVRATCLEGLGDHLAAAEAMGRVVELEAPTASRYRQVAELYELAGDGESAAANLALAAELEADYVDAKARDAYQYLYEVCRRRGLPLVAVQYPAADVTLVEALFQPGQEVTVVDNGPSFRDAIERDGYDTYFTDRFGGEFGHATTRGNQLLASNVADAILAAHFEDEN